MSEALEVVYAVSPPLENGELNALFQAAWPQHTDTDFAPTLERCLLHISARLEGRLVGFVKVAWDGGIHGFLLDPTVHPDARRQGVGRALMARAALEARARGLHWLHVDFEPALEPFYRACGFADTRAGLLRLDRHQANT